MKLVHRLALTQTLTQTLAILALLWLAPTPVRAEPTNITVRVLGLDATFVGSATGGMEITLTDLATGTRLAHGITDGTAGDGAKTIGKPLHRGQSLATDNSALFSTTIDIDKPTRVQLTARGPLNHPDAENTVTASRWVLPGRHITTGDGWVIEIPGLIVQLLAPQFAKRNEVLPFTFDVSAHITPMCGCGVKAGGYWPPENFDVKAVIKREGDIISTHNLSFSGNPSLFNGQLSVGEDGKYTLEIWVFDTSNANAGFTKTQFEIFASSD